MALASDYFKMAAANLQSAIQMKQEEITQLRKSIDSKDSEVRKQVSEIHTRIRVQEADMARPQDEQRQGQRDRAVLMKEVTQMHGHVADEQRNLAKYRDDIHARINQIEHEIQDLNGLIRSLQNRQ